MDDSISIVCKTLACFCNHLQTSCDALKQSIERRPIPLDSASSTFIQRLNRRVSSTSSDLNMLESMSFGTVSFEELLGHCNEVHKKNQSDLLELEDRLRSFGYVPELEIGEEDEASDDSSMQLGSDLKTVEADPLFDLSLQDLGISDVCLATITSEANSKIDSTDFCLQESMKSAETPKSIIELSKNDYEDLPSFMKSLASWEDLLAAVEKMNSSLNEKEQTKGGNIFHQDELALRGLVIYATSTVLESVKKAQEQNTAAILSRALQMCKDKPVKVETLILEGDPKDMICQASEQMNVDILVVGSRGLSKIKRAFLGSVSDYCAHHAKCPILVVKPPKECHK